MTDGACPGPASLRSTSAGSRVSARPGTPAAAAGGRRCRHRRTSTTDRSTVEVEVGRYPAGHAGSDSSSHSSSTQDDWSAETGSARVSHVSPCCCGRARRCCCLTVADVSIVGAAVARRQTVVRALAPAPREPLLSTPQPAALPLLHWRTSTAASAPDHTHVHFLSHLTSCQAEVVEVVAAAVGGPTFRVAAAAGPRTVKRLGAKVPAGPDGFWWKQQEPEVISALLGWKPGSVISGLEVQGCL